MAFWGPVLGVLFGVYLVLRILPGFLIDTLANRRRQKQFKEYGTKINQSTHHTQPTGTARESSKSEWGGA